jgi:hypothetical protein
VTACVALEEVRCPAVHDVSESHELMFVFVVLFFPAYTLTPCAGSQRIYIVNGTNDDVLNSIRAALTAPTQYQVSLSTYADSCVPRNQTLERVEITRTGVCSVADKKREAAEYYYPYYYYSCNETFNYYIQCNQSDCTECDPVPQSLKGTVQRCNCGSCFTECSRSFFLV